MLVSRKYSKMLKVDSKRLVSSVGRIYLYSRAKARQWCGQDSSGHLIAVYVLVRTPYTATSTPRKTGAVEDHTLTRDTDPWSYLFDISFL